MEKWESMKESNLLMEVLTVEIDCSANHPSLFLLGSDWMPDVEGSSTYKFKVAGDDKMI